ncbi:MAG: SGNH/GDSL hydrolase family protein [Clostridia bacterium]|mgnify:FL=1|nr:SGNH/GDSL hydrolase family protein [Clostridia bacterium]MBQ2001421.1 SGNH/GDSL hydrolase family protein [Clostridia bacterium]MBQ2319068.1 SGNH/GDSL hydrolase family protein [Clostridia bacterium]MBQ2420206.1 SGNH/GDSL hydrolase family protein [Clostridia bacterium]MBQ5902434.1 SGNH/GDSL hydrolase family protein [Clostridia bacterium]
MLLKKNDRLLFFGDSVTDADRQKPDGEGIAVFNPWGSGYVGKIAGFLGGLYPELEIRVVNKGISGNQTRHLLERFETDVKNAKPNVIVMMIGANDAWRCFDEPENKINHVSIEEYRQNMINLADLCLGVTDRVVIMSPYMIESNMEDEMVKMICAQRDICREICEERNIIFVDTMAGIQELLEVHHPYFYSWDRIHPSSSVQFKILSMFFKAIGIDMNK